MTFGITKQPECSSHLALCWQKIKESNEFCLKAEMLVLGWRAENCLYHQTTYKHLRSQDRNKFESGGCHENVWFRSTLSGITKGLRSWCMWYIEVSDQQEPVQCRKEVICFILFRFSQFILQTISYMGHRLQVNWISIGFGSCPGFIHVFGVSSLVQLANDLRMASTSVVWRSPPKSRLCPWAHQRGSERESMNHWSMYSWKLKAGTRRPRRMARLLWAKLWKFHKSMKTHGHTVSCSIPSGWKKLKRFDLGSLVGNHLEKSD